MHKEDVDFVHALQAQVNAEPSNFTNRFFYLIIGFFFIAIIWAYFSDIDELARGEGKVIPSEKIQTIQSLDGGIIAAILVKEGSFVKKGQALIKIDTTRYKASLDENKKAYWGLLVSKVRLTSAHSMNMKYKIPVLRFSRELKQNVPDLIESERVLYRAEVKEHKIALEILENQLGQKIQELFELKAKKKQLLTTKILVREEFKTIKRLVDSRAKSKIELITVKKELNIISGDIAAINASIPKANLTIEEAKNRIIEKINNYKSENLKQLHDENIKIKKYESILIEEEDKLDKTVVKSPVNGVIKLINVNTVGGVVRSGDNLIEIVPESDVLLIEAKIDPKDIAFINPEQKTVIKITAYDFSIYGGLEGQIVEISADSIIDKEDKNQKPYYRILVKTNKNYLERKGKKHPIIPGMIASVDIITGQKSILDFLLKPILKTKQNAFHER